MKTVITKCFSCDLKRETFFGICKGCREYERGKEKKICSYCHIITQPQELHEESKNVVICWKCKEEKEEISFLSIDNTINI